MVISCDKDIKEHSCVIEQARESDRMINKQRSSLLVKHLFCIISGLVIGVVTGYFRAWHPMSLWGFSDLAGKYGFWILTVSLIAYTAAKPILALVNSLEYMICMCITYYLYLYFFKNTAYIKLFFLWACFASFVSWIAYLLNRAKLNQRKYDFLIYCLPLILLGIEGFDMLGNLLRYKTDLFQTMIDLAGFVILAVLFSRTRNHKERGLMFGISFAVIIPVAVYLCVL